MLNIYPDQGIPAVLSPLLINIALNGIENIQTSIKYINNIVFYFKTNR
jgi:RNA-directed DNA polymerase